MDNSVFQFFKMEDVVKHKTAEDCFVIFDNVVYDISNEVKTDSVVNSKNCGEDISSKVSKDRFLEKYNDHKLGSVVVTQDTNSAEVRAEEKSEAIISGDTVSITNILAGSAVLVLLVAIIVFLVAKYKK